MALPDGQRRPGALITQHDFEIAMSVRKPPRLANWLLGHLGPARQNPPLTGDLVEEFRTGGSAAWFWRQTLVAILTGLARNVRLCWWSWTGAVIAFALWRFHFPPQLPLVVKTALVVLLYSHLLWRSVFRRKPSANEDQPEWGAEAVVLTPDSDPCQVKTP
jgi:hypothetical protein